MNFQVKIRYIKHRFQNMQQHIKITTEGDECYCSPIDYNKDDEHGIFFKNISYYKIVLKENAAEFEVEYARKLSGVKDVLFDE